MSTRMVSTCMTLMLFLAAWALVPVDSSVTEAMAGDVGVTGAKPAGSFGDYWFQGKAELSRFELEQARYGEVHQGHAVLIFVTEDFLPQKQVKADDSDRSRSGAWPILKLNFTKKFNTGIYPYSIMSSVFTPLDVVTHPRTLKANTSVQEWCGHTFVQLNLRKDSYHVSGYSYFQSEGDREFDLAATWLEDEIWTRIRIDPAALPRGRVTMIPGGQQHRLRHEPLQALSAEISVAPEGDGIVSYKISYPESQRTLEIRYEKSFPHRIEGWRESYSSGGMDITTQARRTHTLMLDYWSRHSNSDLPLRGELGL